jgi:phosphopantothenoylcysteine synthetase/decarboxylase
MREKGCDYIVLNCVGKETGFASVTNRVTIFKGGRKLVETPLVTKEEAAEVILDRIASGIRRRK